MVLKYVNEFCAYMIKFFIGTAARIPEKADEITRFPR